MTGKTLLGLTAILTLLVTSQAPATNNSPEALQQVADAAREGLHTYLQKIPVGMEKNYGFNDRAQFERASLGRPVHQVLMNAADGTIEVIDTWRIPILVDGRSQSLLTVARHKNSWKVVEIGAAKMAAELGTLERQVIGGKPNLQVAIFRVLKLRSDFLAVAPAKGQLEAGSFHPMTSARTFLKLRNDQKFTFEQLKTLLAQKLSNQ